MLAGKFLEYGNVVSGFFSKARTKGTRDISILYAFDLEKEEPICSVTKDS